jgi:hypothetical protein
MVGVLFCPSPGGDDVTNPNLAHLGVKLPLPMKAALTATANLRGTTASMIVRDALARELAQVPSPNKKPAQPAQ